MSVPVYTNNGTIPGYVKVDPVIRFDGKDYNYKIEKGANAETIMQYNAQTSSLDSVIFSVDTVGSDKVMNRRVVAYFECDFALVGTSYDPAPGALLFPNGIDDVKGNIALRWMPVHNTSTNLTLVVGGVSNSYNPQMILEPLDRYSGDEFFNNEMGSIGPSMHDTAPSYQDSYQTLIDPLADYYNGQFNPRGSTELQLISNTPTSAVLRAKWCEPVIHPLLESGRTSSGGFYGLNQTVTIQYSGGIRKNMLSIRDDPATVPVITDVNVTFHSDPYVLVRWLTPPVELNYSADVVTRWPFTSFFQNAKDLSQVSALSSNNLTNSGLLTLTGVPSKMLICLREHVAYREPTSPDIYANIENVSITFANNSGILAASSSQDLFLRACNNGLRGVSLPAWERYVGSPLLLDFARDIPLPAGLSVDMNGQMTISIDVRYKNLCNRPVTYQLLVIPFYSGVFTMTEGQGYLNTTMIKPGSISANDVISSIEGSLDFSDDQTFYDGGASFLDKTRSILKSKQLRRALEGTRDGLNFGLDTADAISGLIPGINLDKVTSSIRRIIPKAEDAIKALAPIILGSGLSGEEFMSIMLDAGYPEVELRASGLTGGCLGMGLTGGSLVRQRNAVVSGQRRGYIRKHLR